MANILPHIMEMPTYQSGKQPVDQRGIKLNLNENPFPPSKRVFDALQSIQVDSLNRYPDQLCQELCEEIAKQNFVKTEQVFCGNGSSEIISLLFTVFIGAQGRIALPDPTFSLYENVAARFQVECVKIPTREDYTIDLNSLIKTNADAIILVNPNAPTGLLLPSSDIEYLVCHYSGLIVIDEAYIDFADPKNSAVPLIHQYDNVIVLRTFSKVFSLSGIRIGYCFSNPQFIAALEKSKNLYHVNTISHQLALAALKDKEYLNTTINRIKQIRNRFSDRLKELGFTVLPSETNFILCTPPSHVNMTAKELYEAFIQRNIYVRYFDSPRLKDKLRISVGTEEEMEILFNVVSSIIKEEK